MKKNYIFFFSFVVLILVISVYFQIQSNAKTNLQIAEIQKTQNLNESEGQNQQSSNEETNLQTEILKEGSGVAATTGDKVSVNYVGTFLDGTSFDSNTDTSTPFIFTLGAGQVIKGWDLGVAGMKVGEKRKLTVPYDLAYGESGYGPIPPKSTLVFEIDLLKIEK
jgi:FKBP-type peptidyl-prolyl cis-trans isomerase